MDNNAQLGVVLVVEDEPMIALDVELALQEAGYRVLGPVPSGNEALDILRKQRPDVAVLDIFLGRQRDLVTPVAARLKELRVPFLLTSVCEDGEIAEDDVLAGSLNLGKPTDTNRLLRHVARLMTAARVLDHSLE